MFMKTGKENSRNPQSIYVCITSFVYKPSYGNIKNGRRSQFLSLFYLCSTNRRAVQCRRLLKSAAYSYEPLHCGTDSQVDAFAITTILSFSSLRSTIIFPTYPRKLCLLHYTPSRFWTFYRTSL